MAEQLFPSLMVALNLALSGIFGSHTRPVMTVRMGDLLFDGIPLCQNPGIIGGIACAQIRSLAANVRNMQENEDGSLDFTILRYKHMQPSHLYVVSRGLTDVMTLGVISSFNGSSFLNEWVDDVTDTGEQVPSVCNKVNGTDSGVFPPFVDRNKSIFALNTDICRSVELRYQYDNSYEGIPTARFSSNEWFLDNDDGCFCLNVTRGITRDDGCLFRGAIELYSCLGAFLVLSYPHFLYADFRYRNGIFGLQPIEDDHRIFLDLEPNTGTVVRGMKRAQFNVFMRPVTSIPETQNLRTTLTPILWVEEGIILPDKYVDMLKSRLLQRLGLLDVLIPVVITACCLILVLGIAIIVRATRGHKTPIPAATPNGANTS